MSCTLYFNLWQLLLNLFDARYLRKQIKILYLKRSCVNSKYLCCPFTFYTFWEFQIYACTRLTQNNWNIKHLKPVLVLKNKMCYISIPMEHWRSCSPAHVVSLAEMNSYGKKRKKSLSSIFKVNVGVP